MIEGIDIPANHPRAESLKIRELIVKNFEEGVLAHQGLIAHGRGEAFDYLMGEKTIKPAKEAINAAAAVLLVAKNPVISVNGNSAALVAKDLVELANLTKSKLEINLFYHSKKRENSIKEILLKAGAKDILGVENAHSREISEINSYRRKVDSRGIYSADVVMVPLEDGDRTEALTKMGKIVIAIDINPLSRTSIKGSITIVDNIIRTMPLLINNYNALKNKDRKEIWKMMHDFNNLENLTKCIQYIVKDLLKFSKGITKFKQTDLSSNLYSKVKHSY
jgi:4-phosphopantoate--beta-alanine ligase